MQAMELGLRFPSIAGLPVTGLLHFGRGPVETFDNYISSHSTSQRWRGQVQRGVSPSLESPDHQVLDVSQKLSSQAMKEPRQSKKRRKKGTESRAARNEILPGSRRASAQSESNPFQGAPRERVQHRPEPNFQGARVSASFPAGQVHPVGPTGRSSDAEKKSVEQSACTDVAQLLVSSY